MRVVFFGTPEPAALALEALLRSRHEVMGVITQPDRPKGRSGRPVPSMVKERALAAGVPVLQPETPREQGFAARLADLAPHACAVVAYGHILPPDVLAIPPHGFVNVHFSLLPRYRGAAPVQRALMAGDSETGVTTFRLEPTLDTGPILLVAREPIAPDDSSGVLMDRLARIGARLLVETLDGLEAGTLTPRSQENELASPAPKIKAEEGQIDWSRPAAEIVNLIRALDPAPGAFTTLGGKRLKAYRASVANRAGDPSPKARAGTIVDIERDRVVVATGDGVLELLEVQQEGGKRVDAGAFLRGHRLRPGDVLGN